MLNDARRLKDMMFCRESTEQKLSDNRRLDFW
jgi:hypothetical protein